MEEFDVKGPGGLTYTIVAPPGSTPEHLQNLAKAKHQELLQADPGKRVEEGGSALLSGSKAVGTGALKTLGEMGGGFSDDELAMLHQPTGGVERYLESIGRMLPTAVPGASFGPNAIRGGSLLANIAGGARHLYRGAIVPGVAAEGAADAAHAMDASPDVEGYARIGGAVLGPGLAGITNAPSKLGRAGATAEQLAMKNKAADLGYEQTASQILGDPRIAKTESRLMPETNQVQREQFIRRATRRAGDESPEGVTSSNPLLGQVGWLEKQHNRLIPHQPNWAGPSPTPAAQAAEIEYGMTRSLERGARKAGNPFPSYDDVLAGSRKGPAGKYNEGVGRNFMANEAKTAKELMPPLPEYVSPELRLYHSRPAQIIAALTGGGAVAAGAAGQLLGHDVASTVMSHGPALATGLGIGAGAYGAAKLGTAVTHPLRSVVYRNFSQPRLVQPYNPYKDPLGAILRGEAEASQFEPDTP